MDLFEEGVDVAIQEPLPEACIRAKERLLEGGFEDVKKLEGAEKKEEGSKAQDSHSEESGHCLECGEDEDAWVH